MKKIIPFKKDIIFQNHIREITSISLEHTLNVSESEHSILGEFMVSGEYLMTDESINTEPFSYELPFDIRIDEKYILSNALIDIDDFYYEIVNDNVLSIHIDVLVDKLEEQLIPVEPLEEVSIPREEILESDREFMLDKMTESEVQKIEEPRCIEPEDDMNEKIDLQEEKRNIDVNNEIQSIFDGMNEQTETYKSYKVYIVREGDDLELIMEKYHIAKEELELYNDLKEIKIGDKVIIPCSYENA